MEAVSTTITTTSPSADILSDSHPELDQHLSPHSTDPVDDNNMNDEPQCFKMEDFEDQPMSPSSMDDGKSSIARSASPAPGQIIVTSRQAKKRKSWGQQLPEPKTTLPPRKRAKTDDEKEQRRIERIKRNRAAAHNSRERKRQETENLAVLLARAKAELSAYRKLHGPLPDDVVLPEVTLSSEDYSTPAPSLSGSRGSRGSIDYSTSPSTKANQYNQITIKQEPMDYPFTPNSTLAPSDLESSEVKASTTSPSVPSLDQAQHSAEMLSSPDLQCQSRRGTQMTESPACTTSASPSRHSTSPRSSATARRQAWAWSYLFIHLLNLQMQSMTMCSKSILLAIWTHSPLRTERLIRASTARLSSIRLSRSTTSSTNTPQRTLPFQTPLRSNDDLALAQLHAATRQPSSTISQGFYGADSVAFSSLMLLGLKSKAEAKLRQLDGSQSRAMGSSYGNRVGFRGVRGVVLEEGNDGDDKTKV